MKGSEWRKIEPELGCIAIPDLLADLEAAENELNLVDTALDRRQALDDCPTRYDKILRACNVASRAEKAEADLVTANLETAKWHQAFGVAEAERDRYDMALQSLTPGGSEFVHDPERCVETVRALRRGEHEAAVKYAVRVKELEAECAALKAELADLRPFFDTVEGMWPWIVAEGALVSITARIRARREKEAVK
jgi:hypothetical protein